MPNPSERDVSSTNPDHSEYCLTRVCVPELDTILGTPFPVLDSGFVRVVDYMGSDLSVVQAARVSYGAGTKRVREDSGLLRYLLRHAHTTPFEMCEIKLHVRVPMDTWRQWIRHRTASTNEYSTRYSVAIDDAQTTPADQWRLQSTGNRQGSQGLIDSNIGRHLSEREEHLHELSRNIYEERLEVGVAREQARKDLPLSTYTEAYWKTDLHNLLHFLALRMNDHAQDEIRQYATVIGQEILRRWCPLTWEAFLQYRINSLTLSEPEIRCFAFIASGQLDRAISEAIGSGLVRETSGNRNPTREGNEFEAKIVRLGLKPPWK